MVTREEVAAYAGVSKTTVSRVMNNNGYVSSENRKKVEEAVAALGYKPNLIARSLKMKSTRQILFYAPDMINPFYFEVYQGMDDCAVQNGYTIVVSRHFKPEMINGRQFDGIILSDIPREYKEYLSDQFPAVVTSYTERPMEIPYVGIDIRSGAISAMQYLIDYGHKDICFSNSYFSHEDMRCISYMEVLRNNHISFDPDKLLIEGGEGDYYSVGHQSVERMLSRNVEATAITAFNDATAIGILAALHKHGLKVPEDISVMGFDDIRQAAYTYPPLTTVHIPKYEQGYESMKMLIDIIQGEKPQPKKLKTQLIVRESTAAL